MTRKSKKKRMAALKCDSLAYRREVPGGSIRADEFDSISLDQEVILVGRIMLADKTGKISKLGVFEEVNDEQVICLEHLESNGGSVPVFLLRTDDNIQQVNSSIHYGDVVMIEGVRKEMGAEGFLIGHKIKLLSKAIGDVHDSNIDFRKKPNLYSQRHLDFLRNPEKIQWFRKCFLALASLRQFLYRKGYEETNMTLLQNSFEAGLANPFETYSMEHEKNLYLRVTSELFLWKLMIAGFSKVFEIGKSFRNQKATANMLPQFTILELYHAYASRDEIENLVREMICEVIVQLHGHLEIPTPKGSIDCSGKWGVCDFSEEVKRMTGSFYCEENSIEELLTIADKMNSPRPEVINKYSIASAMYSTVMSQIKEPTFLRNLPAAQSPLYHLNTDGSTVDETLLVINGELVADIVNPERDPEILRRRMEDQLQYRSHKQGNKINEDILTALNLGLPPSRGVGIGVERMFKLLLNAEDISEIELFPLF